ncbi:hypothetical protein B1C78_16930 [Thioalkalivibrio denitrificans]|uniref:Antitoxin n=1 Tax=Thioalkalivibrio denitrificans TaxID=108003 RepID=A0A1V3N7C1_9GAMM|nr:hypothetical protein B1C78_16930 [Thioalkalivibrio denitrificans]
MRTTIDIEDDVLEAAKEIARREHVSAGRVISRLLREALSGRVEQTGSISGDSTEALGGFRPFPSRGPVVSNAQIDRLRDEEGV